MDDALLDGPKPKFLPCPFCSASPQIKPLVWIECSDWTYHDEQCQYELEIDGLFWRVTRGVTGGTSYVANADTLEAAKAAAQSDYEARIRAALVETEWDA